MRAGGGIGEALKHPYRCCATGEGCYNGFNSIGQHARQHLSGCLKRYLLLLHSSRTNDTTSFMPRLGPLSFPLYPGPCTLHYVVHTPVLVTFARHPHLSPACVTRAVMTHLV